MRDLTAARIVAASLRVPTGDGLSAPDVADLIDELVAELDRARTARLIHSSVRKLIDAGTHTPARIHAYLAANSWERIGKYSTSSDWRHMGAGPDWTVRVLDESAFVGYAQHVASMVETLAEHRGVGELQVLADIAEAPDV